jgi:hypothetical protein
LPLLWQPRISDASIFVPYPKEYSQGWTEAILSELFAHADENLVACLPPLHWSDGSLVDLSTIALVCHANDIILILYATQAVGIMPLDMQILRQVLACSVHMCLQGPSGVLLVYIGRDLHETYEPLDQHGRSRDMKHGSAWEAYPDQMTERVYPEQFCHGSRKFDGGEKPNSIVLPMLQNSLEQVVKRIDLDTAQLQAMETMVPFLTWVNHNHDKFELPPGNRPSCLPFRGNLAHESVVDSQTNAGNFEIVQILEDDHQIFFAVCCGAFRVAPYRDRCLKKWRVLFLCLKILCKHTTHVKRTIYWSNVRHRCW